MEPKFRDDGHYYYVIGSGFGKVIVDGEINPESLNPVTNKAIANALAVLERKIKPVDLSFITGSRNAVASFAIDTRFKTIEEKVEPLVISEDKTALIVNKNLHVAGKFSTEETRQLTQLGPLKKSLPSVIKTLNQLLHAVGAQDAPIVDDTIDVPLIIDDEIIENVWFKQPSVGNDVLVAVSFNNGIARTENGINLGRAGVAFGNWSRAVYVPENHMWLIAGTTGIFKSLDDALSWQTTEISFASSAISRIKLEDGTELLVSGNLVSPDLGLTWNYVADPVHQTGRNEAIALRNLILVPGPGGQELQISYDKGNFWGYGQNYSQLGDVTSQIGTGGNVSLVGISEKVDDEVKNVAALAYGSGADGSRLFLMTYKDAEVVDGAVPNLVFTEVENPQPGKKIVQILAETYSEEDPDAQIYVMIEDGSIYAFNIIDLLESFKTKKASEIKLPHPVLVHDADGSRGYFITWIDEVNAYAAVSVEGDKPVLVSRTGQSWVETEYELSSYIPVVFKNQLMFATTNGEAMQRTPLTDFAEAVEKAFTPPSDISEVEEIKDFDHLAPFVIARKVNEIVMTLNKVIRRIAE